MNGNSNEQEGKRRENNLGALLFATLFSLLVGAVLRNVILKWCKDNDLTEKEALVLIFVFGWIAGLVLMVLSYVIALLMLLFE